jgi:hypothetical protein
VILLDPGWVAALPCQVISYPSAQAQPRFEQQLGMAHQEIESACSRGSIGTVTTLPISLFERAVLA